VWDLRYRALKSWNCKVRKAYSSGRVAIGIVRRRTYLVCLPLLMPTPSMLVTSNAARKAAYDA
jgi:hypothetical protein